MTAIETELDIFVKEADNSVELIIGSDEHLDLILSITNPLNSITEKFEKLNNSLYTQARLFSKETVEDLMPRLRDVNKSILTLIGALSTSLLYKDVRVSLSKCRRQYDLFKEVMHDLHYFKAVEDTELDNILAELNDL